MGLLMCLLCRKTFVKRSVLTKHLAVAHARNIDRDVGVYVELGAALPVGVPGRPYRHVTVVPSDYYAIGLLTSALSHDNAQCRR